MDISKQVTLGDEPADVTLDTPVGPVTVTAVPFDGPGHYVVSGRFLWDDGGEDCRLDVDVWPPFEFPVRSGSEDMWTSPRTDWPGLS